MVCEGSYELRIVDPPRLVLVHLPQHVLQFSLCERTTEFEEGCLQFLALYEAVSVEVEGLEEGGEVLEVGGGEGSVGEVGFDE